jgi:DNA excision repair protein ERCC-8
MNQLLFDRSTGSLSPQAVARIQTSQLIHAIQPAPRQRFDGGEKETALTHAAESGASQANVEEVEKIWAHQAGVNALSIDIDGRT